MGIADRRVRERAERHRLIVDTARTIAEAEGWDAVTTRRLSADVEYSQPVLYKHFGSREDIVAAVALEGFAELAADLRAAVEDGPTGADAVNRVAQAYLDFADRRPAVYEAMFVRTSGLRFASADTPTPLTDAFTALADVIAGVDTTGDADTMTEAFWAALHGMVVLGTAGRLREGLAEGRLRVLVLCFVGGQASVGAAPTASGPPTPRARS